MGRPPADLDPKEALSVLLGSTRVYGAHCADIVPYDKAKMAWPPRSSQPVELIDAVAPADKLMLRDWEQRLLLRGGVCADGEAPPDLVRSYIDPILRHSPAVYGDFVRELAERGLLSFMAVDPDDDFPVLGIFCVKKKNGMSRLIFDTRALNQRFEAAPHTELPSAAALCGMEVRGDHLVMASCDVENAFYNFRVPNALARCFRLPPVAARFCSISEVDGVSVAPWQRVQPYLTTLPMGWAWALHLCQSAVQRGVSEVVGDDQILKDKRAGIVISGEGRGASPRAASAQGHDVAAAVYVDNIAVFACSEHRCRERMAAVVARLQGLGLPIHEEAQPSREGVFIGWKLCNNIWSIKSSRMWRLRWAIEEVLRRGRANSPLMEVLVGHCTWHMMGLRSSLSAFDSA